MHYEDIAELQRFVKDNEELTDMLMQKLKTFMAGMAIQCREKRQEQRRKAIASVSEKDAEADVQKIMAEFH